MVSFTKVYGELSLRIHNAGAPERQEAARLAEGELVELGKSNIEAHISLPPQRDALKCQSNVTECQDKHRLRHYYSTIDFCSPFWSVASS